MAGSDNIHAAMDLVDEAMKLLSIEMTSSAARSCLMQFARGASGKPTGATPHGNATAEGATSTSNSTVEGTSTKKKKRKNKRSLAKRAERSENHSKWLRQQEVTQKASDVDANAENSVSKTALQPVQDAPQAAAHITETQLAPLSAPAMVLADGQGAKRDPSQAPLHSPHTTPAREHTGKKSKSTPDAPHHQSLFPPSSDQGTPRNQATPPQVAMQAQDFAHKAIAASPWFYLTRPDLAYTYNKCVHKLANELLKTDYGAWHWVCNGFLPQMLNEQCVMDNVQPPLRQ